VIKFAFSALPGSVFGSRLGQSSEGNGDMRLEHYQAGFAPLFYGIILALVLTGFLKEAGPSPRQT
jgi:hypothetical protein